MTFADFQTALRLELFPQGEAPELVATHIKSIKSALIDLQKKVECLQVNNTQTYEFCSTMFQCGMSVLNAPRGKINKVSTFVRLDEDCEEDAESPVSFCKEVKYGYIPYPSLTKVLDRTLRTNCNSTLASLLNLDFGVCEKMLGDAYPAPDDADYEGFPELPYGFHYPQSSTDSTKGRAGVGVWAIERGRIYLAPWIQSTEIVVVEWDGVKVIWEPSDLVDDDPAIYRAAKLYLAWEHARDYDKNTIDYEIYEKEYREAVADLIYECDKESRGHIRRASKARMSQAVLTDEVIECTTSTTTHAASDMCEPQNGTGSPVGVVTPDCIGQQYLDTTNPYDIYVSTGLTSADWLLTLGGITP